MLWSYGMLLLSMVSWGSEVIWCNWFTSVCQIYFMFWWIWFVLWLGVGIHRIWGKSRPVYNDLRFLFKPACTQFALQNRDQVHWGNPIADPWLWPYWLAWFDQTLNCLSVQLFQFRFSCWIKMSWTNMRVWLFAWFMVKVIFFKGA